MSWLFSQALVEEYSAGTSLDGEPSSQLNVMPTPHKFWRNDKTMEFSDLSRFGLKLRLLTEQHGEELLMSYLAASRARTFPLPERAGDWRESAADYGPKWYGSFARYTPAVASLWKTVQCSLLGDSESYSETWPRWGLMHDGVSFLRPTPALRTCGNESGLWPTPTVHGNYNRPGASATSGMGLASAVRLWPTPSAGNAKWNGSMQEWGGSWNWVRQEDPELARGPLNPQWVEWLMGWPIGWTDLKPLGTAKFHEWRQQHGGF